MQWQTLAVLGLVAALAVAFRRAAWPHPAFRIRIRRGQPEVTWGRVDADFLDAVADLCRRHRIGSGTIRGVPRGDLITLAFSRSIPPTAHQPLRNVWTLHVRPARKSPR